ncbi:MAG: ribonuclease HI [Bacteroidales bacterium]|nr:ribonuclease HI [Bacteroidales bacterium]
MEAVIVIYTDGGASGNPGPGGLGVVMKAGKLRKEISEAYRLTTNNRMELLAVIRGLEAVKWENAKIRFFTDSKYVSEAVNQGWLMKWEKTSFKNKKNPDLWIKFLELYRKHNVEIKWIKGHANNIENERCDELAVKAYKNGPLSIDEGYENTL